MSPVHAEYYPPSPRHVPPQYTKPSSSYRWRVLLVAASLFLFLLIYFALIALFATIGYFAFNTVSNGKAFDSHGPGMAFILIAGAGFVGLSATLVVLYFVKGLFKLKRGDDHHGLEVTEADHPRLFAFIRQICAETGAPAPAKIVLSPEVNAGVFYTCTFWSLFVPMKKNLHIGLGLVNCLNLQEFKAVMAHEFGHFSQRSMRLGAYVYTANRVIAEIIYGRDWFDNALSAFDPVLNLIRKLLAGIFHVINFANSSLSRQMEFQADLVAVSVTGSDAVVHGLLRSDFAQQCLDHTWHDLTAAGDHGLLTRDIFLHQTKAADYLRALKNEPKLGVPPDISRESGKNVQVFPPNETVLPPMWASHPPHYEREQNTKRNYISGAQDERPAWVLFDKAEELRQEITKRHYELVRKGGEKLEPKPAEEVQRFIDDDRAETMYAARYHGMYEEGLISPGELDKVTKNIPPRWEQPSKLLHEHAAIFSEELRERLKVYRERVKDQERLVRFVNKVELPKGGVFEFRGKKHRTAEAEKLLETLEKELHADHDYLSALDRRIFLVYMGMAGQIDPKTAYELEQRYRFHVAVQDMVLSLTYWNRQVQYAFGAATATREPSPESIQAVGEALRGAQDAMGEHIASAAILKLPAFKNMRGGEPLSFFLDAKPVIHDLFGTQQILDGTWINQILNRHNEVIDKLRRVLFKSLGSLLCFQERVGDDWKVRYANQPDAATRLRETLDPAPVAGTKRSPVGAMAGVAIS